jgi:hypothetical protein
LEGAPRPPIWIGRERHAIIDRTAGSLTREEADEWERIIAEGCEQLDEHG